MVKQLNSCFEHIHFSDDLKNEADKFIENFTNVLVSKYFCQAQGIMSFDNWIKYFNIHAELETRGIMNRQYKLNLIMFRVATFKFIDKENKQVVIFV